MKNLKALPRVKCSKCDGTGQVSISQQHFDTLQIVKKIGKATSFDVWKHPDFKDHVTVSAVMNRLDDLFKAGLLKRVRSSKAWLYTVC